MDGVGELPDLPQRGARLGKPRPELMPGVRNLWEDLEPYRHSGRSRPLARPHRIVTQHLGGPVWNSSGGRPENSPNTGDIRGSVASTSGRYHRFRNASPRSPSAVSQPALMLIDGLDQEKSKPPLIMTAPAGIGRRRRGPAAT